MNDTAAYSVGAAILGAGRSTRMGRPKLLLPWGETSVLGHLQGTWQQLGAAQVGVVYAENDKKMLDELERLGVQMTNRITNQNADQGMFSSIQCAARWQGWDPTLTHWAIILGDQPHLGMET